MTALHGLWLGAITLMLISLAVLLPPLLKEVSAANEDPRDAGALRGLYQAQLTELEQQWHSGYLTEDGHAQAVEELQRRLLRELDHPVGEGRWHHSIWLHRGTALVLAVALPVVALALYLQAGNPQAVARLAQEQEAAHGDMSAQVEAMVSGLAQRLQTDPQNLGGWVMLARSYETLERYGDAAHAYRQALKEAQRSQQATAMQAQLQANLADALASAHGGDLEGEAGEAIAQALQLDPQQAKALALAGTAALRRGDMAAARRHWAALLALLEPGSDMATRVQDDLIRLEAEGH